MHGASFILVVALALACDGSGPEGGAGAGGGLGGPVDLLSGPDATEPSDVGADDSGSPPDARSAPDAGATLPALAELSPGWNELRPGGETICGDGSPWAFYVRPGRVNRLVIELQGGGSCQSEQTCFVDNLATIAHRKDADFADEAANAGLHDHADPRNPVADWHHVLVSYCTADHHWGDFVATYGGRSFHHKGAVNALTALEWAFENVPQPEKVFVTGRSAGAYGSIIGAAWVAHRYPHAEVYQLGDSGVTAGDRGFPRIWRLEARLPPELAGVDAAAGTRAMYRAVAAAYTRVQLAEVSSAFDFVMSLYHAYYFEGGDRAWAELARATLSGLEAELPRYTYYRAIGAGHVFESRHELYSMRVAGVRLSEWVARLLDGEPPEPVDCEPECGAPLKGDSGAPEEWACLTGEGPARSPGADTADLAMRFISSEGPAARWPVAACGADDPACERPLFETETDAAGALVARIPTVGAGFDGHFALVAPDGTPNRVIWGPPITGDWHPIASVDAWWLAQAADFTAFADTFGTTRDPANGAVQLLTLDCVGSGTERVRADLDGRAPDGYYSFAGGVNRDGGFQSYFLDVEPGEHTVHLSREVGGPVIAERRLMVDPGGLTSLLGLGP